MEQRGQDNEAAILNDGLKAFTIYWKLKSNQATSKCIITGKKQGFVKKALLNIMLENTN